MASGRLPGPDRPDADITLELTQSSDMVAAVGPIKRKTKKSKKGGIKGRLKNGARRV